MYQNIYKIEPFSFVTDIVKHDYRTAEVFRKYDIDFAVAVNGHLMCFVRIKI